MAIFNPLEAVVQEQPPMQSTSSLINDVVGMCPKCKQPFGSGQTVSDTVYYCDSCRVSQPIPV